MERRSTTLLLLLTLIVLFSSTVTLADTRKPKNVQTALRAKWFGTPLLLEACELLSKQEKHLFWNFIDIWINAAATADNSDSQTAKDCVKKILQQSRSLLREPLASFFEFSLILRSASPTLVLYRQLAHDSLSSFPLTHHVDESNNPLDPLRVGANLQSPDGNCCWVDTGEHLFFHLSELLQWLQSSPQLVGDSIQSPEVFDFDHVHFDSSTGSPVAILYGALGTECFKEFHIALVGAAKQVYSLILCLGFLY